MITTLGRFVILSAVALALAGARASAEEESRIAIAIGNSDYQQASDLPNAGNDANLMYRLFEEAKFDVVPLLNVDHARMKSEILTFADRLSAAQNAVGVFYFAGHAIQVADKNYLLPIDTDGNRLATMIPLDWVLETLNKTGAKVKIVIIDACRNNPFPTMRALSSNAGSGLTFRGLARVDLSQDQVGMLLAFSTSPGQLANDDGGDGHSPYTGALARFVGEKEPGLPISTVFIKTRAHVLDVTNNRQLPTEANSTLRTEFYFHPPVVPPREDRVTVVAPQRIPAPVETFPETPPETPPERKKAPPPCSEQGHYQVVGVSRYDRDGGLNRREGPSLKHRKIDTLPYDAEGLVLEDCNRDQTWCRVRYPCQATAWVRMKHIAVMPGPQVSPVPVALPESQGFFRVINVRDDDVLYIRDAPNPQARMRGKIPPYASDVQVGQCRNVAGRTWCYAQYLGIKGWVSAKYLVSVEDDESHPE